MHRAPARWHGALDVVPQRSRSAGRILLPLPARSHPLASHTPPDVARAVVSRFAIPGECASIESFERGHIHDTFVSTWRQPGGDTVRYLHQRVNDSVFTDVPALMNNIAHVTGHLARCYGAPESEGHMRALELVPTTQGSIYLGDDDAPWRTYVFIEGTRSFDRCDDPKRAHEAARAFGQFQADLADLDISTLRETIPHFFSSPYRLQQLDTAIREDRVGRVASAMVECTFVQQRREMVGVIERAMQNGEFPQRIVHGDTKLNNLLFEEASGRAVCVVDLDTCMPGWSLYDFGDLVRFTAARCAEDEPDLARAGTDFELFRALVAGYLEGAGAILTPREIELLPLAARLVTLTVGMRFLADHLAGDRYFKVSRENHNLDRARVQFAMVRDMERQRGSMERWVRSCGGDRVTRPVSRREAKAE